MDDARNDELNKLMERLQRYPNYGRAVAYMAEIQTIGAVPRPPEIHFLTDPLLLARPELRLPPPEPPVPVDWHRMKVSDSRAARS